MPIKTSLNQQNQENKMQQIASNLTDLSTTSIGRPKNSNGSTSGDAALNIGNLNARPGGILSPLSQSQINTDKKVNRLNKINEQIKASKPGIENKTDNTMALIENNMANNETTFANPGSFLDGGGTAGIKDLKVVRERRSKMPGFKTGEELLNYKTVKKSEEEIKNNKSATNGGMLRGTSTKITSRNNPKFNSTIGKGSDPSRITSGSITPSNPVNIKSNTSVVKSNKESTTKNSSINPYKSRQSSGKVEDVNESSKSSKLGVKTRSKVSMSGGRVKNTPVNNNKNKNTKKVKPRKVNPTVNNKFNLEDELASVSSKKGL